MSDAVTLAAKLLKEHRDSIDRLDAILVFTLAERGSFDSNAISPKKSPVSMNCMIFSRPSSDALVTFTRPCRITYM